MKKRLRQGGEGMIAGFKYLKGSNKEDGEKMFFAPEGRTRHICDM